jgi:uncharacterized protein (DUF305 family)
MEELYWQRIQEAKMNFNEADVKFMTDMIGHHAQALIMSDLAPKNGASPEVQTLAARIINAQKDEFEIMQKWLEDRGQPVPRVKIEGLNLIIEMEEPAMDHTNMDHSEMDHSAETNEGTMEMDHSEMDHSTMDHSGMVDHSHMIGMLSPAQMIELSEAKGPEFDRLFLQYMIQHHSGAVVMVEELLKVDGAAQADITFELASDINVDQTTEIERMRMLLLILTGDVSDM